MLPFLLVLVVLGDGQGQVQFEAWSGLQSGVSLGLADLAD